jgi:hypothetical protein
MFYVENLHTKEEAKTKVSAGQKASGSEFFGT